MKAKILEYINRPDYTRLTVNELAAALLVIEADDFKEFVKTIVELEDAHILYRDRKDRFDLIERFGFKKGIVQVHKKGFGFVSLLDEEANDVFIPKNYLNGAMNKDKVLITISKRKTGNNFEGEVVKVIERGTSTVIGVYFEDKNVGYIKSDDTRFNQKVMVNKNNSKGAMPDHKVKAEIINYLGEDTVEAKIIEILGHKNDPGIDILSVVYKYGMATIFPEDVIEQANSIPDEITEADIKGRRDLREQMIVTIDGEDAKDLDDAVPLRNLIMEIIN
jgi:ribonuclease R